jgi:hypothetical protein
VGVALPQAPITQPQPHRDQPRARVVGESAKAGANRESGGRHDVAPTVTA